MWLVHKIVRKTMDQHVSIFVTRESAVEAITKDQIVVATEYNHAYAFQGLPRRVHAQYRRDEFEYWSVHEVDQNIHDPKFEPEDVGVIWDMKAITIGAWVELD